MEKIDIIVPVAKVSPTGKPKYLWYDYKGDLMVKNSVAKWINDPRYRIIIGVLREHDDKFNASDHIKDGIPNVDIVVLDQETLGAAHTVYRVLEIFGDSGDRPIFVKDCDSWFDYEIDGGDEVCYSSISSCDSIHDLSGKSFLSMNENDVIMDIVEKSIVSENFCVGGYSFSSSKEYIDSFGSILPNLGGDIYVSHIIQKMMAEDSRAFMGKRITNYVDVGNEKAWLEFNNKPTIFCDIDGTIIKAQSRFGDYSYHHDPIPLTKNINIVKGLIDSGSAQVIFVTARPTKFLQETKAMLEKLGFVNPNVCCGLNNAKRILINDYNDANPYPRAEAINIRRDSDNLSDFLLTPSRKFGK